VGERSLPESAIERNVSWIEAVERGLADQADNGTTRVILKAAGAECARQILRECEQLLGRRPETVSELLAATNVRRRRQLGLSSEWELDGNRAHLEIDACGCTLVKAGLARPNPVHCLCTVGMFETLFSAVSKGPVEVEVVRTIGDGASACEFYVHFEE
jgi:predicted hydrocarbon binding protein